MIALLIMTTIFNSNTGFAQTKAKHHKKAVPAGCPVVTTTHHKHHVGKKTPMVMREETITINDYFPTSVVQINKGKIYVNDSLVSKVINPKYENHKIIINYIAPSRTPSTESVALSTENTFTGKKSENPILGVHTCNSCGDGAMVKSILLCGPADKAGLFPGDVITKVNDHTINNSEELAEAIGNHNAGDNVTITYKHFDKTETTEAILADREKEVSCGSCEKERPSECYSCPPRRHRRW